jgi:hypothetical protein
VDLRNELSEAMAATGHRDDVGAEEDSVEDGAGGGHIAEEFAPVFDWGGKVMRVERVLWRRSLAAFARTGIACGRHGWHFNQCPASQKTTQNSILLLK